MSVREAAREPSEGRHRLSKGDRLGPYEVLEALGAGGMGEVFRARDPRLRRDVALKVINPTRTRPESVERFEREARAAAALNHPNILAVFDISMEGPVPYVVSELLQGESLRARLDRGPLPYHKALDYGIQIAQGLAAAHGKGIYHRDVKPANVFLSHDGQVKLLDFGLAKLTIPDPLQDSGEPTVPDLSHAGHALGTVGYMSPEQVLGEEIDHRADIFALGAVLYEMLTGSRAFQRATPYETMYAIRKEEPEDPLTVNPSLAPGAAVAVRRCLEKSREERFQSARDLAFHLNQLAQSTTGSQPIQPRIVPRRRLLIPGALAAVAVLGALVWLWPDATEPGPSFLQVTFHRGRIGGARFAGQSIVYSETLGLDPPEVSLRLAGSPEARRLGYVDADVLAACSGELLLSMRRRFSGGERFIGTLAMAPLGGGTPHEILEDVEDADCEVGTDRLVVARARGLSEESQLEYPVGTTLYRSAGSLHEPRLSRDAQHVAFREDPPGLGIGGRIVVVDREGEVVLRSRDWMRARGLAWSPEGDEVWFTAAEGRENRALRAVSLDGRERLVYEGPGSLTLWDTAPDGRVLITRDDERVLIVGQPPGGNREIDLSWFDHGGLGALSSDGRLLVLGDRFGIYLRRTDGSPAAKLGSAEGFPDDLSPDGSLVLATTLSGDQLFLVPTGPGEARSLPIEGLQFYGSLWLPDGHRILVNGREPNRKLRSYVTDVSGRTPEPITEEGAWTVSISPDGEQLATITDEGGVTLWPVAGGAPRPVPGSEPGDRPVGWSEDGETLWIFRRGEVPAHIDRLEIATGRRERWKDLVPADAAGVYSILGLRITPSGHAYFYNYRQALSELYEVRGLR